MGHKRSYQLVSLTLWAALTATSSAAFPGAGPGGQLDGAARNLTQSAQNLVYLLQSVEPNSDAYQEAETLVDAAQLFQDRVEGNPDDLGNDFSTIESTFDSLKQQFISCHAYQSYDNVKNAWVNVEQANLSLRLDWLGGGQQQPGGGGGFPPGGGGFPPGGGGFPPPPPPPGGWQHGGHDGPPGNPGDWHHGNGQGPWHN